MNNGFLKHAPAHLYNFPLGEYSQRGNCKKMPNETFLLRQAPPTALRMFLAAGTADHSTQNV
jgi:hypothetical protein